MVVFMLSPDDSVDELYISNYALRQVRDQLLRLDGIGDIQMFGARDYSMRLWLDPDKIATLGLTAGEMLAGNPAPNLEIPGGPAPQPQPRAPERRPRVPAEPHLHRPPEGYAAVRRYRGQGR